MGADQPFPRLVVVFAVAIAILVAVILFSIFFSDHL
jgi:preprotein translocase subunit Sec61beta